MEEAKQELTAEQRHELLVCAGQAEAHGRYAVASWYRHWAHTGKPNESKPDDQNRAPCGGPIS